MLCVSLKKWERFPSLLYFGCNLLHQRAIHAQTTAAGLCGCDLGSSAFCLLSYIFRHCDLWLLKIINRRNWRWRRILLQTVTVKAWSWKLISFDYFSLWLGFFFGALLWGSMIHKYAGRWMWQRSASVISWSWEKYSCHSKLVSALLMLLLSVLPWRVFQAWNPHQL